MYLKRFLNESSSYFIMSPEYSYSLKIPKERIAVLIGKNGQTKKEIEELTDTKLNIDSKEGDVKITGSDSLKLYTTREIVKAIGRGFNPNKAKTLIKPDYILEVINIKEFSGQREKYFRRIKGRLIGKRGKARKELETLSECYISIYGKTISLIGKVEDVSNLRIAVEKLIKGAPHSHAYKFLEDKRREKKSKFIENKEFPS